MLTKLFSDLFIAGAIVCLLTAFYYDYRHYIQEMAGKKWNEKLILQFNLLRPSKNRKKSLLFGFLFVSCLFIYLVIQPT